MKQDTTKPNIAADFKRLALNMGQTSHTTKNEQDTSTVASLGLTHILNLLKVPTVLPIRHFHFKLHNKLVHCYHYSLPDM